MFTVKLYYDQYNYNSFTAPHYHVASYEQDVTLACGESLNREVFEITLYKDFSTQNGVTYKIAKELDTPHWQYCYIENSAGKTIDHLRPSF